MWTNENHLKGTLVVEKSYFLNYLKHCCNTRTKSAKRIFKNVFYGQGLQT